MIDQQQLPGYIEQTMPELSGMCNKANCASTYDIVRQMLQYTTKQIVQQNTSAAKQCLQLAAKLYTKGNKAVKNAIENVFVYSFTHAFFQDEARKKALMEIVPDSLYQLYRKQILYSHL